MQKRVEVPIADTLPTLNQLMARQGVPADAPSAPRIRELTEQAISIYHELAKPIGLIAGVTGPRFAQILAGEGHNAADHPLARIYPQANDLALFAVTVGLKLSERINELFATHEYAAAYLLDMVASEATDQAAAFIEQYYQQNCCPENLSTAIVSTLRYSPGYCGWHISGQAKLFAELCPQQIGISLTSSYLMQPLKSISGVLVTGPRQIHLFTNNYSFCRDCRDHTCRRRIAYQSINKQCSRFL